MLGSPRFLKIPYIGRSGSVELGAASRAQKPLRVGIAVQCLRGLGFWVKEVRSQGFGLKATSKDETLNPQNDSSVRLNPRTLSRDFLGNQLC